MRLRLLLVGAVFASSALLAGCVGIPETGPVVRVAAPGTRTHNTVRYEPAKPRKGGTPQQIVEGYLDAMLAYPEATAIVKDYLTPRAAETWRPTAGVTVYSKMVAQVRGETGTVAQVALRSHDAVTVDGSGRASNVDAEALRSLRLERVSGQWRVDTPVSGYLISQDFADDYLRSYPLWFFDASGQRLVPELVHEVVSDQLPIALARRLAQGPREGTLRTFIPSAGTVRIKMLGKVAEVDIREPVAGAKDKITAQLLSTLRGVPGLDGVRILLEGVADGEVHPIDAVVGFGPGPVAGKVYGLRDGRVVDVAGEVRPMAGPWGRSARDAVGVAVDTDAVAAVQAGRNAVVLGSRNGGGVTTIGGTDFVDPLWDTDERLWLVDHPGATRIRVVRRGAVATIDAGGLGRVESFAVSPDGSRYAAVTASDEGAVVSVGLIAHGADGEPTGLLTGRTVSSGLAGERSVRWASQTRVEFIAAGSAGRQLTSVGFDGVDRAPDRNPLPGGIAEWAGPPIDGADRWALDDRGRVWRRPPAGEWRRISDGSIRALSAGR